MAAELPHDVILQQIITRLPLKYAVQCRILNKHFHKAISMHALLSWSPPSSKKSIIFHHSIIPDDSSTQFTIIESPVRKSKTLPDEFAVLDSCNGILLLHNRRSLSYYAFNPLTGGLMLLNYIYDAIRSNFGALVPANNNNSHVDFKLVEIRAKTLPRGQTRLRFRILVPSSSGRRKLVMNDLSYSEDFYLDHQGSFSPVTGKVRPVYAHGFLHWLGAGATAMVAFDVETGRARVMPGPVTDHAIYLHKRIWFGFARGSLQFVILYRYSMRVHSHDYVAQEWRMVHEIETPDHMSDLGMRPVFFDGEKNVFVHVEKPGVEISDMYVHDLSTGKWYVSGEVYDGRQNYMEFVPTTARVSDVYVEDMLAEGRSTKKVLCLRALQHLFLDSCS